MKLLDCIQIVFIVAKLWGVVDWNWGITLIPLYITVFLIAVLGLTDKGEEDGNGED